MMGFALIALLALMVGTLALGIAAVGAYALRELGWSPKSKRERIIEQMRNEPVTDERCPSCGSADRAVFYRPCNEWREYGRSPDTWHDVQDVGEGVSPEAEDADRGSVAVGDAPEPRQAPSPTTTETGLARIEELERELSKAEMAASGYFTSLQEARGLLERWLAPFGHVLDQSANDDVRDTRTFLSSTKETE